MGASKPILVLGDIAAEILFSGLSGHPRKGQEAFVSRALLTVGGAGAVFACGLARLGRKVRFAGTVGRDAAGDLALETMKQRGVDVRSVTRDSKRSTDLAVSFSEPEGRSRVSSLGAVPSYSEKDLSRYSHVHIAHSLRFPGVDSGLATLLRKAKAARLTTSMSPGWDPRERWSLKVPDGALDVLLTEENEAKALTKAGTAAAAAKVLAERATLAVVRRGERGAVAATPSAIWKAPGDAAESLDFCGSESTFDAAFIDGWLDGHRAQEVLVYACAAAGWSRERRGGVESQPTRLEALHRVGIHR
jgi:sugar/nucleoside kinase (ribokinase family)